MTLFTALRFGTLVGTDEYNNRYYLSRRKDSFGRQKRIVRYHGKADPSCIPPEWHGWLHYTFSSIPKKRYSWQQEHHPNFTGTSLAYFPPGYLLNGGRRDKATGDYVPWEPK